MNNGMLSFHHCGDSNHKPLSSSSLLTVEGGLTVAMSEKEGKNSAHSNQIQLQAATKLSLVLDLGHTLVHATNDSQLLNLICSCHHHHCHPHHPYCHCPNMTRMTTKRSTKTTTRRNGNADNNMMFIH